MAIGRLTPNLSINPPTNGDAIAVMIVKAKSAPDKEVREMCRSAPIGFISTPAGR